MNIILVFVCFLLTFSVMAEEKLSFKTIFTEVPASSKWAFDKSFSKEALPAWGAIAGSSVALWYYDEKIYSDFQKRGRDWGIGNEDNTSSAVTFGGQELLRLPTDTGSFLYFLGDGWMHAGIGGGFLMKGQISDNAYAYNTGMMIWHGMVVSTIYNQILKRSTGRESPNVSTSERGSWNLFPSFNEYNSKTANYDAVPSGHVMTATLTFTIISERYPEYNNYTYPVAGVWVSALMFQMVNNGVHWASDYPLGIAMGYVFGKAATQMTKTSSTDLKDEEKTSWRLQPTFNGIYAVKNF
jgi:membrane-associated phospholipid phosphatase